MDEAEIIACIDAVRLSAVSAEGDYQRGMRAALSLLKGRVEREFGMRRAVAQDEAFAAQERLLRSANIPT